MTDGSPTPAARSDGVALMCTVPAMRVLTWNLWWRFCGWEDRLAAIRSVLTDINPDICTLQEVWGTPSDNQAAILAEHLGMTWTWSASPDPSAFRRRTGEHDVDIGVAVLSRWPIRRTAELVLSANGAGDRSRTVLHASIDAPQGPVPVFTTHLASSPHLSATRCAHVAELAAFVAEHAVGHDHPPIVSGDLNAEPDSDEVRLLGGHKTAPSVPGLVLIDVWRYADPPAPGWTWDRRNPHVAATRSFDARIDYVMVGVPGPGTRGAVESVTLAGHGPVQGVWPSDHLAVVADLR